MGSAQDLLAHPDWVPSRDDIETHRGSAGAVTHGSLGFRIWTNGPNLWTTLSAGSRFQSKSGLPICNLDVQRNPVFGSYCTGYVSLPSRVFRQHDAAWLQYNFATSGHLNFSSAAESDDV